MGFTLVELLMAIAIIGILAGLFLPALASGKRKAKRVKCINNMKQMVQGWYGFAAENRRPLRYHPESGNTAWLTYLKQVAGLTDEVLMCPVCNPNLTGRHGDFLTAWRVGNGQGGAAAPAVNSKSLDDLNPSNYQYLGGRGMGDIAPPVHKMNHSVPFEIKISILEIFLELAK